MIKYMIISLFLSCIPRECQASSKKISPLPPEAQHFECIWAILPSDKTQQRKMYGGTIKQFIKAQKDNPNERVLLLAFGTSFERCKKLQLPLSELDQVKVPVDYKNLFREAKTDDPFMRIVFVDKHGRESKEKPPRYDELGRPLPSFSATVEENGQTTKAPFENELFFACTASLLMASAYLYKSLSS